ncbi:MAG: D-glycerate dehydrogenase [Acetobacteraceae bacterium]|nr:D-glycerate dehydrogenase [Acetobacteraceae bacterium]
MKPSVYVTRAVPEETLAALRAQFDVEVNPDDRVLSRAELMEKVKGRAAVVSLLTDTIDGAVLDAAGPQCRIVANYAVGYNNFDVAAATARGVVLTNTPGVLDNATATHTIALMLAAARRIPEADRYVRSGAWHGWAPLQFIGQDVDGKVLGVAGLGRIGRNVARKARAFDMQIIYTDAVRNEAFEAETGARFVDKATLLAESDFLTLHTPLMPETHHYIGAAELRAMKPNAVLVNASRGPVVMRPRWSRRCGTTRSPRPAWMCTRTSRNWLPAWQRSRTPWWCRTSPRRRGRPGLPWARLLHAT